MYIIYVVQQTNSRVPFVRFNDRIRVEMHAISDCGDAVILITRRTLCCLNHPPLGELHHKSSEQNKTL